MAFTVGELAKLTGVTVRALHHYDELGLVRPSARSDAGYRLYDDADVMRLQQVLVYRELGLPLDADRGGARSRGRSGGGVARASRGAGGEARAAGRDALCDRCRFAPRRREDGHAAR